MIQTCFNVVPTGIPSSGELAFCTGPSPGVSGKIHWTAALAYTLLSFGRHLRPVYDPSTQAAVGNPAL